MWLLGIQDFPTQTSIDIYPSLQQIAFRFFTKQR